MSEAQSELLLAIRQVVAAFDSLGIDYLIGGSVASSVHGEPRQTLDADLVASVLGKHVEPLVKMLAIEFYADLQAVMNAVIKQGSFNLIHLETMTKIDVFVSWRTPFGQSQMRRRQRIAVGENASERLLFFASPEDTILAKLDWFRKGGCVSDRQWRDILGVIKVQERNLSGNYLAQWAREFGVEDLLRKAFLDAGVPFGP